MKQYLCDICKNPAVDINVGYEAKFGEPWQDMDGCRKQPLICVSVGFSFHALKTGYGGPPDLCECCATAMLEKLLAKMKVRALKEPTSP